MQARIAQPPLLRANVKNNVSKATSVGKVYLGAQSVSMNVVYDTAYDNLIVQDESCLSCKGNKYNSEISATEIRRNK